MTGRAFVAKTNLICLGVARSLWQLGRMPNELTQLPDSFSAGTTVSYRKSFADYPASGGWTLTLYLAGASVADIVAVADGDDFVVTITPTDTTGGFSSGHYKWVERVSKSGEVYDVATGVVTIEPDLATAIDGGEQSWLETSVDALKAHIAGRLPAGMEAYAIAGRQVSKIPVREAIVLLTDLEARLASLASPDTVSRPVEIWFKAP